MSKFRILSIFLAVGLLVGALGVGPILAGQIDVTGLDTRDASYAPYALDVDEGEVEWATDEGDDVAAAAYANDKQMAVFYVNDDDLEGTSDEQIATWTSTVPATNGVTQGFNVLNGHVATVVHTNFSKITGPKGEDVPATTTTFAGNAGNTPIHSVTMIIAKAGIAATSTLTDQALITANEDLVKVLGGTGGVNFDYLEIRFKHHKVDSHPKRAKVVSDSDPQGEYVTVTEVAAVGSTEANASSNIYRGAIMLSDDPANRGPGEDPGVVWVQDGDSLTVHYLDDEGDIVDSDSITVDAMAPAISGFEPADGTNTSVTNPTLQFDATDEGSGFDSDSAMDHFTVTIGTQLDADGENPTGGAKIDSSDPVRANSGCRRLQGGLHDFRFLDCQRTASTGRMTS